MVSDCVGTDSRIAPSLDSGRRDLILVLFRDETKPSKHRFRTSEQIGVPSRSENKRFCTSQDRQTFFDILTFCHMVRCTNKI